MTIDGRQPVEIVPGLSLPADLLRRRIADGIAELRVPVRWLRLSDSQVERLRKLAKDRVEGDVLVIRTRQRPNGPERFTDDCLAALRELVRDAVYTGRGARRGLGRRSSGG